MNAALLMGPGLIELIEVPCPPCPEGGLLLKVVACGVCGSDIRAYHGRKQITQKHAVAGQTLPGHIIGHEIAGVVEAVGSGVASFHPGELVTVAPSITCGTCDACRRGQSTVCQSYQALGWHYPGGFAEYVAVPARLLHDGSVNRIPEGVSAWKACLAEPLACVIHAQDAIGIGPGDSVLVLGAGPMACLNLLLARYRGASFVAVTDPNACRRDQVRALGADLAVDSNAADMVQVLLGSLDPAGLQRGHLRRLQHQGHPRRLWRDGGRIVPAARAGRPGERVLRSRSRRYLDDPGRPGPVLPGDQYSLLGELHPS